MLSYNILNDLFNINDDFTKETEDRNNNFPHVQLYQDEESIEIRAVVPGIENSDLKITLEGDTLYIEGERTDDTTDQKQIRRERVFGAFKKVIQLPFRVEEKSIDAKLKNGILSIKLTKSEDAKPKRIEIK